MAIVTALPGLAPTARAFVMDAWPQGQVKTRSGRVVKWAQSSAPAGASLELVWENITYAQAETILKVWDASYGEYGSVTLATETLAGLDAGLAALIRQPFANVLWRADGRPVVEAVKARRCTVRMALRTRRDLATVAGGGGGGAPPSFNPFGAVFVVSPPVLITGGVVLPGVALAAGLPVLTTGGTATPAAGTTLTAGTPTLATGSASVQAVPGATLAAPAPTASWGTAITS